MKRFIVLFVPILITIIFVFSACCGVEEVVSGDFRFELQRDDTYAITECISTETVVEVPSEYNGKSVTAIDDSAFYGCTTIEKVIIPSSVKSIGDYAFQQCDSLKSVVIHNGVTSIGHYVFYNCTSIEKITIPRSVTSVGSDTFRGCTSLTIYCESAEKPTNWYPNWNSSKRPVVWRHTHTYEYGYCVCGMSER